MNLTQQGAILIVSVERPVAAAALIRPGNETEAQYFFESRFRPYRVSNIVDPIGLFTGYYEPELRGAWKPDTTFRYPLYARPKDLVSLDLGKFRAEWKGQHVAGRLAGSEFVPYSSRADINQGVLKGASSRGTVRKRGACHIPSEAAQAGCGNGDGAVLLIVTK